MNKLRYAKIANVKNPLRAHKTDAGFDVFVPESASSIIMRQGDSVLIPTGLKFEVPEGYMLQVCNKSSVASKKGLVVGAHIVDTGYAGQFFLNLHKVTGEPVEMKAGEKIAQLVIVPIVCCELEEVKEEELYNGTKTERGEGGFGSTNK